MLEIDQLKAGYAEKVVVEVPCFTLGDGEHCLILGSSGSGKTTLLSTLAGLLTPLAGNITLDGQIYHGLSGAALDAFRGRHIGIIYQTLHMVGALTVMENLQLARYAAGLPPQPDRALQLLERFGIAGKKNDKPGTLSQGQQQRVAIARSVVNEPKLIVGDEPTSALDDAACHTVMELLLQMADSAQASLVIATHDQRIKGYFHKQISIGGGQ